MLSNVMHEFISDYSAFMGSWKSEPLTWQSDSGNDLVCSFGVSSQAPSARKPLARIGTATWDLSQDAAPSSGQAHKTARSANNPATGRWPEGWADLPGHQRAQRWPGRSSVPTCPGRCLQERLSHLKRGLVRGSHFILATNRFLSSRGRKVNYGQSLQQRHRAYKAMRKCESKRILYAAKLNAFKRNAAGTFVV